MLKCSSLQETPGRYGTTAPIAAMAYSLRLARATSDERRKTMDEGAWADVDNNILHVHWAGSVYVSLATFALTCRSRRLFSTGVAHNGVQLWRAMGSTGP